MRCLVKGNLLNSASEPVGLSARMHSRLVQKALEAPGPPTRAQKSFPAV